VIWADPPQCAVDWRHSVGLECNQPGLLPKCQFFENSGHFPNVLAKGPFDFSVGFIVAGVDRDPSGASFDDEVHR
jgi:hypothetical protein